MTSTSSAVPSACARCGRPTRLGEAWASDGGLYCPDCGRELFRRAVGTVRDPDAAAVLDPLPVRARRCWLTLYDIEASGILPDQEAEDLRKARAILGELIELFSAGAGVKP